MQNSLTIMCPSVSVFIVFTLTMEKKQNGHVTARCRSGCTECSFFVYSCRRYDRGGTETSRLDLRKQLNCGNRNYDVECV